MYTQSLSGKQNTENTRPVYTRELPPGRTLAGAEPGFYGRDGSFAPWEKLGAGIRSFAYRHGQDAVCGKELTGIGFRGLKGVYALPEGITAIGRGVFSGCAAEAVVFPSGLVSIGPDAFRTSSIRSAVFPQSLCDIGEYAFRGSLLRTAVFPDHPVQIGRGCFSDTPLASAFVPDRTLADDGAFSGSPVF